MEKKRDRLFFQEKKKVAGPISRHVAGIWLIWSRGLSRVFGSTNERDKTAPRTS